MNPALETLLLPFSRGELAVPSQALFLGAEPHPDLHAWPALSGWQPWRQQAEAWDRAGFTRMDHPTGTWPLVLALPGKSRDETLALFATAYDLLAEGGTLVAALANDSGAARFEKELAAVAGEIHSLQKHKCRVFSATKRAARPWDPGTLAEWRALAEPRSLSSTPFLVVPGIFSADGIDPGSELLIQHLPTNLRGTVADLGAGWGYLAREIAARCPGVKALDLYEADARALDCARHNLASAEGAAGPEIRYHWHDVTAGLPGKYEAIVTNPPFHRGQTTDVSLGLAFLRTATAALRTGGRLFLVANRQLPYEAELDALGLVWRKPVETGVYKLLFAEKRMPAPRR